MFGLSLSRNTATKTKNNFKFDKVANRKPRVLLVDDNEFNIMIAGTYLENFGLEYDVAKSGHEALERIRHMQYMAILMDIQMPVMDGMETSLHIREYEAITGRERQPIIALTAHPLSGDREACEASGMDDYISKPFNPTHLKEVIDRLQPDNHD